MSITELSIKRPLLICVLFFSLLLFGVMSYQHLNYELIPKFEIGVLTVNTTYMGASPQEVQTSITKPIEDAVVAIEGIDQITSTSEEGVSTIVINLKSGINVQNVQLDVERTINQIRASFPENAEEPVVMRFSTDDFPIIQFSVTSSIDGTELYDFIDRVVRPELSNLEGVAQVKISGGTKRQINVYIDNDKLAAYDISPVEVNQAVVLSGAAYPAGNIGNDESRFSVNLNAKVKSVNELKQVVIRENQEGSRVLLSDVASITDGEAEETELSRINGQPAIGIQMLKQTDANAVKVSALVRAKLKELQEANADKDFQYQIANDQSVYTMSSAEAAMDDLMLAILIVAFVMLFFLHSLRSASFVLVAIPSALIPTFIAMYLFGFSLNMMTLIALSLVIGVLVDDSIVVLENIYRHLEMKKGKREAAIEGRSEISYTAIAITLVDVVVFAPLSMAGGMLGGIFREYSLVIVFSTLLSLFVAFTLTPLMASRWGKLTELTKNTWWMRLNRGFESILTAIKNTYAAVLTWALNHKRYVFGAVTLLFIGAITLMATGFIGADFFPYTDRGEINIQLDLASQTPLKQTNQVVMEIEDVLMRYPEVKNVFSTVGTQSSSLSGANSSNLAELSVVLVPQESRSFSTAEFVKTVRNELDQLPGVKPTIRVTDLIGNTDFDIQFGLRGVNMDSVLAAAEIVRRVMMTVPGTDYVQFSSKEPRQQVSVTMDREKMARLGVSVADLGSAVQYAFRGNDHTKFYDHGDDYKINLMLDEADRGTLENLRSLNVINSRGASVPLDEVTNIEVNLAPAVLERTDRMNSIIVNAAAVGRPGGTITEEVMDKLEKTRLPQGVSWSPEGNSADQQDAFGNLGTVILIGILLMYLVMVALYESVVDPLVVLFSLPTALIGALLALALTLNSLNIFSILGILMLFGLVAKNGILLVDFANQAKAMGKSVKTALLEAGDERIRPIMMTTIAMVCGMLPMALSSGDGAETKQAMAWVIIGGMITSMVFTLILVPAVYMVMDGWKKRVNGWFGKKTATVINSSPVQ